MSSWSRLHNHVFLGKMGLLGLILILEVAPLLALVRWRMQFRGGQPVDTRLAGRCARISYLQAGLVR